MTYETSIHVRCTKDEKALLKQKALARKTDASDLARTYVRQGLAGFDQKHDDLLRLLEGMARELAEVRQLAAGALAAAAVLKQHDESTPEGASRAARKHIRATLQLGGWISQQLMDGLVQEGG